MMLRLGLLILLLLSATSVLAGGPTPVAALSRPQTVPLDYVVTPFGYFHPSCVRTMDALAVLLPDGRIRRGDGVVAPATVCRYPHFSRKGQIQPADGSVDGWVEDSSIVSTVSFGAMRAGWTVPPAPTRDDGQVVYFFPGLEDAGHVVSILQPVLGWNAFVDHAWSIASWNCCQAGYANYSTPQAVSSGDAILGTVDSDCRGGETCASWNIYTQDQNSGAASQLLGSSNYGQRFDWAFGGVLEVYGVRSCQDYPAGGSLVFSAIHLWDANWRPIVDPAQLAWRKAILHQGGCNYDVDTSATATSLVY